MDLPNDLATAEIARLFEVAAREDDAIRRLEACVADLHAVQTARTALGRFSAAELRARPDPPAANPRPRPGIVTGATGPRVVVSPAELKRAWRAVQSGAFTDDSPTRGEVAPRTHAAPSWVPAATERVVPVIGCCRGCGSTTTALALATAAARRVRLVECGSATTSGLVAASTAELGRDRSGWLQGTRGEVLLERVGDPITQPDQVPVPSIPSRPIDLTILDVTWDLGQLLPGTSWISEQIRQADPCGAGRAGHHPRALRRLETTLSVLADVPTVAAVVGARRRRGAGSVWRTAGPRTRAVDDAGRLVVFPADRRLAIAGLDATPLPPPLITAAQRLLHLLADQPVKGGLP